MNFICMCGRNEQAKSFAIPKKIFNLNNPSCNNKHSDSNGNILGKDEGDAVQKHGQTKSCEEIDYVDSANVHKTKEQEFLFRFTNNNECREKQDKYTNSARIDGINKTCNNNCSDCG